MVVTSVPSARAVTRSNPVLCSRTYTSRVPSGEYDGHWPPLTASISKRGGESKGS